MSHNEPSDLRLDVLGKTLVNTNGWKSYFFGLTAAFVFGVGLYTIGTVGGEAVKNAMD